MKALIRLFKNGLIIDKIFIILTPLIIVLGIFGFYAGPSSDKSKTSSTENSKIRSSDTQNNDEQTKSDNSSNDKEKINKKEAKANAKTQESFVKKRDNSIGTSNQDINSLTVIGPRKVNKDVTGNWRYSNIDTNEDFYLYAKSYYKSNFKNDDEIHAIINRSNNTTIRISILLDNVISVDVLEYVNNEEQDAKLLFSGKVLHEYFVYLDNGDVEKIR